MAILPRCGNKESGPNTNLCYGILRGAVTVTVTSKSNNVHDIEDLIESHPTDKTMHDWEQSTIEAEHIIKPLTVEGQIVLDPFMGYGTFGVVALYLKRKFIGMETDKEHYSSGVLRLSKFTAQENRLPQGQPK